MFCSRFRVLSLSPVCSVHIFSFRMVSFHSQNDGSVLRRDSRFSDISGILAVRKHRRGDSAWAAIIQKAFITSWWKSRGCLNCYLWTLLFTYVHSNWQKSMKIACGDGIFALWPSLSHGQRGKRADLPEQ